jgi:hypothetical protein
MEPDGHQIVLTPNSYISLSVLVMVIAATLWIKDGQAKSAAETTRLASEATIANSKVATDLATYKELQAKDAEILKTKIDGLTKIVQDSSADRWTAKDAKRIWAEFGALNPTLKLPQLP